MQFEEDDLDILNTPSNNISLFQEGRHLPGITPIADPAIIGPNLAQVPPATNVTSAETPALVYRETPTLVPSAGAETPNLEAPALDQAGVELAPPAQVEGPEPPAQEDQIQPQAQDGAGALVLDDLSEDNKIEFNIGRVKNSSIFSADTILQDPGTSTPIRTPLPPSPGSPNPPSGTSSPGPPVDPILVPPYLHQFLSDVQSTWNERYPYPRDSSLFPLLTKDVNHQRYVINWKDATKQNVSVLMLWKDKNLRKSREPSPTTKL